MLLIVILTFGTAFSAPSPLHGRVANTRWSWPDLDDDRGDSVLDLFLQQLLQEFIKYLGQGNADLGIPVLDPYTNQDRLNALIDEIMDVKVETSSTLSEGYSSFNVTSVDTNIELEKLAVNMTLPSLYIAGDYILDGTVYSAFPVLGHGIYDISLFSVFASGTARIFMVDGGLAMSNMTLDPIIYEAMSPYFENLMVSVPGARDHVRVQVGRQVVANVEAEVRRELTTAIENYLNGVLQDLLVTTSLPFHEVL